MDPADLLILAVITCLDGLILVWLRHRRRRRLQEERLCRVMRRSLRQFARA